MGVIHKLRPEVRDFILEQKKTTPSLSCRDLTLLILDQFHIDVSKSSINAIFKENNLSMPIGRRRKQKKKKFNMPVLPVIEGVKAITLVAQPSKPVDETAKEELCLGEERIKEAEIWAVKLLENEHNRLERERLAREEMQRKAEEEKLVREKAEAELKEKEALRKVEEEKTREEQLRLQKIQEEEAAKQKEAERLKLEEGARLKEEQEKLDREAELKAERERWARLSEDESKRKEPLSKECTGVVLLKAIDYLVRGSAQLSEAIQRRLGSPKEEAEALTQALIFQGIAGNTPGALSSVPRDEISADKLSAYLAQLQELKTINLDLSRLAANIWTKVRGMKMHFIDGNIVYLDAQMRTVWPTPYMPHDFSATRTSVKDRVQRYFFEDGNLVLFMAPGYDIPAKEFFTLLFNFNSKDKTADNLILYGNQLDELENIALNPKDGHNLLFGLWPWQWTAYRKVKRIGEFSLYHIDCMNKDFYLAEIEIELIEPTAMQSSALKGCAIKLNLAEKIRFVVLSTDQAKNLVSLADSYLCRWPNLDEGFHDFNRKIELFNFIGESEQFFAYEDLPIGKSEPADLKSIFSGYAEALDAYLRWHFMPSGYEKIGLQLSKDRFYSQKAQLIQDKDKMRCFFTVAHDYAYAKDLEYICHRLNERDIRADDEQRVCFESGFK